VREKEKKVKIRDIKDEEIKSTAIERAISFGVFSERSAYWADIRDAFLWQNTPEGFRFWYNVFLSHIEDE
jgi:hypothetical protein